MARKRKAPDSVDEKVKKPPRKRNRASPFALVKLYDSFSDEQRASVTDMELDSMLNIKCDTLNSPLIEWFAGLYDKHTREFVIPARGRIPLNADTVYLTLGLPHGTEPVPYHFDRTVQAELSAVLFPEDGVTPLTTKVAEILSNMTSYDDDFKQIFVMYLVSTILSPTTFNHVSNRCYPIMNNIRNVKNLQWCQFVVDQLHEELSRNRCTHACLSMLQLLYVDSLDVSGLNLDLHLPENERYAINIWSKEDTDKVLKADLQHDGKTQGKLELKPRYALNYGLFGGAQGYSKWIDTCAHPTCTNEDKAEVAKLMGNFASGLFGLMSTLVQGWTALTGGAKAEMAKQFAAQFGGQPEVQLGHGIIMGGARSSAAAGGTSAAGSSGSAPDDAVVVGRVTRSSAGGTAASDADTLQTYL